jgi:aromatic ring-opening dioxygenase catalytic subunit (LigB family)
MSEIAGIFATSHVPAMVNLADQAPAGQREEIFEEFRRLGQRIEATGADTVLLISDDHLHNFFLDNFPPFCIGAADQYPTPIEGWLKTDQYMLGGNPRLGAHILFEVMNNGFDPALSMQMTLDHGTIVPLTLAGIAGKHRIVPVHVNTVQPPMPSLARCVAFGKAIGEAIRNYDGPEKIVVLATGGLSHDVGTPRMGMLNEEFDREFLQLLEAGDDTRLVEYATANVDKAGNGAEEIRNWLVAHGIAGGAPFQTFQYQGIPQWYTGVALGGWSIG